MGDEKTQKAVVLFDVVGWTDRDPQGNAQSHYHDRAADGNEVELPADEFKRLEAAGAVAKPGSAKAKGMIGGLGALTSEVMDRYVYLNRLSPGEDYGTYPDGGSEDDKRNWLSTRVSSPASVLLSIEAAEDQLGDAEAEKSGTGDQKVSGAPDESGAESKKSAGAQGPEDKAPGSKKSSGSSGSKSSSK